MLLKKWSVRIIGLLVLCVAATYLWSGIVMRGLATVQTMTKDKVSLSIFMYHSILKDSSRAGEYVISPEQFENDIRYLKDNGYHFITMSDLVRYVNKKRGKLPDKPVIITFDDGFYNNYLYAYPIMQKYNTPFVISIIGKYTDINKEGEKMNGYYSHLTWEQLKEMTDSGLVEIQNHSYDLHSNSGKRMGSTKNKGESLEDYKTLLSDDLLKLQKLLKKNVGIEPNTFTYPYGRISPESVDILRELGFDAALTCASGINDIGKGDIDLLLQLKRYNRPHGKSSESYFQGKLAD